MKKFINMGFKKENLGDVNESRDGQVSCGWCNVLIDKSLLVVPINICSC
jgi:hypothetical protein